jgi:hypothetical protein
VAKKEEGMVEDKQVAVLVGDLVVAEEVEVAEAKGMVELVAGALGLLPEGTMAVDWKEATVAAAKAVVAARVGGAMRVAGGRVVAAVTVEVEMVAEVDWAVAAVQKETLALNYQ